MNKLYGLTLKCNIQDIPTHSSSIRGLESALHILPVSKNMTMLVTESLSDYNYLKITLPLVSSLSESVEFNESTVGADVANIEAEVVDDKKDKSDVEEGMCPKCGCRMMDSKCEACDKKMKESIDANIASFYESIDVPMDPEELDEKDGEDEEDEVVIAESLSPGDMVEYDGMSCTVDSVDDEQVTLICDDGSKKVIPVSDIDLTEETNDNEDDDEEDGEDDKMSEAKRGKNKKKRKDKGKKHKMVKKTRKKRKSIK